ncbi:MAG TPA: PqiC family protein [Rhodopila sp.]|nr:PqiC family protein [Rhodopila sp.]
MDVWRGVVGAAVLGVTVLGLAACAGPPLTTYTITLPPNVTPEVPSSRQAPIVAVPRVLLPAEVDNTDLIVRDGSVLRRSITGRWGSRLAIGITYRLVERLAARYPQALVLSQEPTDATAMTLRVSISRLTVGSDGTGVLDADWAVVPRDDRSPERRQRTRIVLDGPVGTDQDVVALTGALVDRLAAEINLGTIR